MAEAITALSVVWAFSALIACFGWGMWFDETYSYGKKKPAWAKDIHTRHVMALALLTAPVAVVVGAGICTFLTVRLSSQVVREAVGPLGSALVTSIEKRIS